jgi:hypothetical protein
MAEETVTCKLLSVTNSEKYREIPERNRQSEKPNHEILPVCVRIQRNTIQATALRIRE